jgi:alpha-L-fucosidase
MRTREPGLFAALDEATKQAEQAQALERMRVRRARERAERDAKWAATTDEQLLRMRIEESSKEMDPITSACLAVAVPMWIDRMRHWLPREIDQRAHALVDITAFDPSIAALVDDVARATTKKRSPGSLGKSFNAIAEGLACLAHCPGGIVFAGSHWEVKR